MNRVAFRFVSLVVPLVAFAAMLGTVVWGN
jgi:hypothetical protein